MIRENKNESCDDKYIGADAHRECKTANMEVH